MRLVALASQITGGAAGLYVVDIGGLHMVRLAGPPELPGDIPIVSGVGPEFGRDGLSELREHLASVLPGSVVSPLWLRGRATAALVATQGMVGDLDGLARAAAPAVELASGYTDVFERGRRLRETSPAAEIQQGLLGPRMAIVDRAEIVGSLLPAYDVGGDWFDHAENPEGAWLAVADAVGHGTGAAAISVVTFGAIRAARRAGATLEGCCVVGDEATGALDTGAFTTALLASWRAQTRCFSWINCGHPPPLLLRPGAPVEELSGEGTYPLGVWSSQRRGFPLNRRTLKVGDRVLMYTDGVTERRTPDRSFIGIEGLVRFLDELGPASAAKTVTELEAYVRNISASEPTDDATQVVLAVKQ